MGKRKLGALEKVEADLPNLQHKIRRDPQSYTDDFDRQYQQYHAFFEILQQSPSGVDDSGVVSVRDLIDFIAHVADCYPQKTKTFSEDLISLLQQHHEELEPELREKVVGSLVLVRNKDLIDSATLLNTLFPILITTSSKSLRALLYQKILSDLRSSNAKTTNHKLNRTIQTLLFNIITSDRTSSKGLWAVKITRELWKRQIWADAKAAEIMKEAALSENPKIISGGVRFFLGGDKEREEAADESSEDEENVDMAKLRHQAGINKKTSKRNKELKRAAATVKRKEKKKNAPHLLNFSALHLLHDPQGFAETLFSRHLQSPKSKLNLEQKLLVLQLVSRLVGLHQLTVTSLYSFFLKYLTPRQESVTTFLACLAQATHIYVPPETLQPLVQKIANEFVSEGSAGEVCSAGLNAIREICARQPLAMEETLLQDPVQYRKSKDKGVVMAARGLLGLYRNVGAEMLHRRDRGRDAALGLRDGTAGLARFGHVEAGKIEGIELLEAWKEEERKKRREEQGLGSDEEDEAVNIEEEEAAGWKNWDAEEDDSDDSGGWIDVQSDGEDINISDSDDDKPPAKKTKIGRDTTTPTTDVVENTEAAVDAALTEEQISKLATTRILTPADLAKLQELRTNASITALLPAHKTQRQRAQKQQTAERHNEDPLTAAEIEGLASLSHKATKAEKLAMAKGDKEEKHQSTTARRKEKKRSEGKSSTNKEKERQKNFLMTLGKAKRKGKRGLGDVKKALKGHVERSKRGGKRGNR